MVSDLHYRPTSTAQFEWRFAVPGSIVAHLYNALYWECFLLSKLDKNNENSKGLDFVTYSIARCFIFEYMRKKGNLKQSL